ncbi:MAG: phosphoribosyl-AMP cyclohydrolase [Candidatus Omnitrophica bacterium]|nr:phosphoribosyl-AMP cyclohydrolase [Candidatus Omnitrophota bacterium]
MTPRTLHKLKFNKDGLIPAIIQDFKTKDVLMMGYMNIDSLKKTLTNGKTCFWSRSRQKFWIKGMTSGHFQFVKDVYYDCDCDTLLVKVRQVGSACHTMKKSCFYRKIITKRNK